MDEEKEPIDGNEEEPKEESIDDLKSKLAEKEAEIKKLSEKDHNFKELRQQVKELKAKQGEEIDEAKVELEKRRAVALSQAAGGDAKKQELIEYHYNRLTDDDTSEAGMKQRIETATLLASRGMPDPVNSVAGNSGAPSDIRIEKESDDSKFFRQKMRISDEDREKYGNDSWKPKFQ